MKLNGLTNKSDLPVTRDLETYDLFLMGRELPKVSVLQLFFLQNKNLLKKYNKL